MIYLTNTNVTHLVPTDALAHDLFRASDLLTSKPFVLPPSRIAKGDRFQLQYAIKTTVGSDTGTTLDLNILFDGVSLLDSGALSIGLAANSPYVTNLGIDLLAGNDGNLYAALIAPLDTPDPAFFDFVGINDNWILNAQRQLVTMGFLSNFGVVGFQALNRAIAHTIQVTATFNQAQANASVDLIAATLSWKQQNAIN